MTNNTPWDFTKYGDPPKLEDCKPVPTPPGFSTAVTKADLQGHFFTPPELEGQPVDNAGLARQVFQHYGFDTRPIRVVVPGRGTLVLSGGHLGGWELLDTVTNP